MLELVLVLQRERAESPLPLPWAGIEESDKTWNAKVAFQALLN